MYTIAGIGGILPAEENKGAASCNAPHKSTGIHVSNYFTRSQGVLTDLIVANCYRVDQVSYEHPLVDPQVSHFKHVPLRTMVKFPQLSQGSPS